MASSSKKTRKTVSTRREVKPGGRKAAAKKPSSITLAVRGFKSLRDRVEVELRPLTLLSGRNSSGKSSLMQPLLLLKQTLEAPFDYGPLRLDGPNVHFSEFNQLFWQGKGTKDRASNFSISIGCESNSELVFSRGKTGLSLKHMRIHTETGESVTLRTAGRSPGNLASRTGFVRELNVELANMVDVTGEGIAITIVERVVHVPGLRGNPERLYPATAIGERFPGPFPPYTASVIARWMNDGDSRLRAIAEQLRDLGLTWKVEARRLDDTRLELRVARTYEPQRGGAKDLVNVADVGFGVSQVLPVLVALLTAKKGDIVHIEQPEIHLHPAAQARLARPLAAAAKRGVIVVAETHSPLLLRSVQQLVADGTLPARDVAFHWFRRDDAGATKVTTAELHSDGTYGDWPEDFASTEMDVEIQLLAAMAGE